MEKQRIEEIEDLAQKISDLLLKDALELFQMLSEKYEEKACESIDQDDSTQEDLFLLLTDTTDNIATYIEEALDEAETEKKE